MGNGRTASADFRRSAAWPRNDQTFPVTVFFDLACFIPLLQVLTRRLPRPHPRRMLSLVLSLVAIIPLTPYSLLARCLHAARLASRVASASVLYDKRHTPCPRVGRTRLPVSTPTTRSESVGELTARRCEINFKTRHTSHVPGLRLCCSCVHTLISVKCDLQKCKV